MEWVETTARTIEEAKDSALDQLGVDEQDAEFEVLEEPRPGLFGRMRGEARVRARVAPKTPPPKQERRDRKKRDRPAKDESKADSKPDRAEKSAGGNRSAGIAATAPVDDVPVAGDSDEGSDAPSTSGGSRRGGGRKRAGAKEQSRAQGANAESSASGMSKEGPQMSENVTVEEQADIMASFLEGLGEAFGYEVELQRTPIDEETIELNLQGEDLGLLIGPKGATLSAVQDLARTVVQRQATGVHEGRVRIDVSGYRQRRREALERFTVQVAGEVVETGVRKVLEPMGAADRKVIHDAANGVDGVSTISEGEEPRRRVVILPSSD